MKTLGLALLTLFVVASSFAQKSATDVFVMDGDNRIQMKYSHPDTRGSHKIFAAKIYYMLNGPKSDLRIKSSTPQLLFYSDPAEKLTDVLIRLDVKSDRREIRWIKSTSMGTSTSSLPRDHVIDVNIEEVSSEPGDRKMNLYRVTPTSPLKPGEYCLRLHRTFFFDFGIDAKPKS